MKLDTYINLNRLVCFFGGVTTSLVVANNSSLEDLRAVIWGIVYVVLMVSLTAIGDKYVK